MLKKVHFVIFIVFSVIITIGMYTACPSEFRLSNNPADWELGESFEFHYLHMVELEEEWGILCIDCHETVPDSTTHDDMEIVSNEQCSYCHDGDMIDETGTIASTLDSGYNFNHRLHLSNSDNDCTTCHNAVLQHSYQRYEVIPDMRDNCFTCHDDDHASRSCNLCHQESRPIVAPENHTIYWGRMHKIEYIAQPDDCNLCHQNQSDCTVCHRGDMVVANHEPDYLRLHKSDAYDDPEYCDTCHTTAECYNCHSSYRISSPFINPHPPNFAMNHALEAKTNLQSCISCHNEYDCSSCHH